MSDGRSDRSPLRERQPIGMTFTQHVAEQQKDFPGATGNLTGLLTEIMVAAKIISSAVRKAGLADVLGLTGRINVQGEEVQILDEFANTTVVRNVRHTGHLCGMASEESPHVIPIPDEFPKGPYLLYFDPLDGSSNIDVNGTIGTIFSVYQRRSAGDSLVDEDILQPGRNQVVAGYVIYGSSTILVYTAGEGVFGFTLDPVAGEFLLSHRDIRTPERGDTYSVNEGYTERWDEATRKAVESFKGTNNPMGRPYTARYVGSLVADFHRNLLNGGIFLYPGDTKNPKGKLRLFYEASPLAFIAENAGGRATDGRRRVLDIQPTDIHERTPLVIGSREEVDFIQGLLD
jgi:fructose-1,6-bisphosphatase I